MCGRYTGNDDESEEMAAIYQRTQDRYPHAVLKHGEIFPSDVAPILYGGDMMAVPARWGYPAYKGSGILINARAESAKEKVSFSESLLLRRCIIPTTGYYEWDRNKAKYRFNRQGDSMLYLGGFCQRFPDGARFVILTTEPSGSVRHIHDRMPLVIAPDSESMKKWNTDREWALNYLKAEMPDLIYKGVANA